MAKGTIKGITTQMGGTTGIGITVQQTGATGSTQQGITSPPGQVVQGTLTDDTSGAQIPFSISFGAELGIVVGAKVEYYTVSAGGQTTANVIKLAHRGEIVSINATNDGGQVLDKATNTQIPFAQTSANATLAQGTKVNFERIVDPNSGNITAVALIVVQ
jgi:hypothetical protein